MMADEKRNPWESAAIRHLVEPDDWVITLLLDTVRGQLGWAGGDEDAAAERGHAFETLLEMALPLNEHDRLKGEKA
jgi:hypothetical protein